MRTSNGRAGSCIHVVRRRAAPSNYAGVCVIASALLQTGSVGFAAFVTPWRLTAGPRGLAVERSVARRMSEQDAAQVLGIDLGATQEELRRAFRSRAREAHPDGGGTVETFRHLREAYAVLRRGNSAAREALAADVARGKKEWAAWEDEVAACNALADEGDVLYWRPDETEDWRLAVVLAVQVVREPSSGWHGWIYLQPLLIEENNELVYSDEDADMEQVEPMSPDGVNWCFADAEPVHSGRWRLGKKPYLPPACDAA